MPRKKKIKINSDEADQNLNNIEEEDYLDEMDDKIDEDFDEVLEDSLDLSDDFEVLASIPGVVEKKDKKEEEDKNLTKEERLKKELDEAKAKATENWENFLRARADYENFKKRAEQQIASSSIKGKKIIVENLLEVIDNFERALNVDESKTDAKNILIGVRMIHKQLMGILEDEGLKQITTKGEMFNPRFHEAIETVTSDKHKDEEIVDEVLKGYMFKDEIIRPAKVKVARVE